MANRALELGLAPGAAAGALKIFLFSKTCPEQRSCPFIYGQNIYVFTLDGIEVVLLTVYRAPQELLRVLVNKTRRHATNTFQGAN